MEKEIEIELRSFKAELRAKADFVLEGRAASYGIRSKNLGGFVEQIAPGAFTKSLNEGADVKCTFNHDPNHVLGRTKSGTLKLSDGPEGLDFRCQLDKNNSFHRDIYAQVKRGDISECSFAFTVPDGGDDFEPGAGVDDAGNRCALRTLRNVNLMDVSAVTYPAYGLNNATTVSARAIALASTHARKFTDQELADINGLSLQEFVKRADARRKERLAAIGRSIVASDDADRRARAARLGAQIAADDEPLKHEAQVRAMCRAVVYGRA